MSKDISICFLFTHFSVHLIDAQCVVLLCDTSLVPWSVVAFPWKQFQRSDRLCRMRTLRWFLPVVCLEQQSTVATKAVEYPVVPVGVLSRQALFVGVYTQNKITHGSHHAYQFGPSSARWPMTMLWSKQVQLLSYIKWSSKLLWLSQLPSDNREIFSTIHWYLGTIYCKTTTLHRKTLCRFSIAKLPYR